MLHRIFLNMDYEILLDSIECYSYSFLSNQESSNIFDNLPSHNIIVVYLVDIAVLYFAYSAGASANGLGIGDVMSAPGKAPTLFFTAAFIVLAMTLALLFTLSAADQGRLLDLLTAGNLFCGFVALTKIVEADVSKGDFQPIKGALGFILLACIFDLFDGRVARMLFPLRGDLDLHLGGQEGLEEFRELLLVGGRQPVSDQLCQLLPAAAGQVMDALLQRQGALLAHPLLEEDRDEAGVAVGGEVGASVRAAGDGVRILQERADLLLFGGRDRAVGEARA